MSVALLFLGHTWYKGGMPAAQLLATASAEEHWHAVAGPWLRAQAATAWKEARPTVVLTPNRAEGFYLRSRLVAEGTPLLGVRFWTPSDARKFLLASYLPKLGAATQTELRLVTRLSAERLAAADGVGNDTLRSVIREPAAFLRAYDLLLGAGWNPVRDGADYGRELALEVQRELEKSGIATQAGLHRQLCAEASASPQVLIANLLVTGFNAAHWPLWDLLKAAVLSTENVVVAFNQPRVFGETVDQLWHSSWEEFAGTAISIPSSPTTENDKPLASLATSYEDGSREPLPALDLSFCVTPDLATQTRAVVLRALDYLRRGDGTRIGIVFPEANALALAVAEELQHLDIRLNDGPGFLAPGIFERRAWQTWLALQEEPGVPRLIAWFRACQAEGRSFGAEPGVSAERIAKVVEGALAETLVDDLPFLAQHLESKTDWNVAPKIAGFLRARRELPLQATFADFLEQTTEALALRGWETLRAELDTDRPAWLLKSKAVISRRVFIAWLREATDTQSRSRGAQANHFYGKVHLLVYGQLGGQTWSHLILTGLNEGVWPRVFEAGAFGSRHELEELNRKARTLNRRARATGAHGEGHDIISKDHGYCLLPAERQQLALRDLCAALEATSHAVCLAAMTTEAGRGLLPSDFFNHAYQGRTGRALDEVTFCRMAQATQDWCREHDLLFAINGEAVAASLEPLLAAHTARRDLGQPFGACEFAYDQPPARPIQLSCKRWEEAWNHPSTVWLESVVGAAPWPEGELSWPRAVGTWAHHWLAQALRERLERGAEAMASLVSEVANRTRHRVREGAAASMPELYPWWEHVWAQARSVAIGLAENLEPLLRERRFLFEYTLPPGLATALPGSDHADFELNGRIDLVLFKPGAEAVDPTAPGFAGMPCAVIDFKTGAAKALSAAEVGKGRGLQSLLYALALRAQGAGTASFALLTRNAPPKEPVDLDTALQNTALFQSLTTMHRDGIFGMRPDAQNDYGFAPSYPMATRFIAKHILETKWARTHGGEVREEEEDEP